MFPLSIPVHEIDQMKKTKVQILPTFNGDVFTAWSCHQDSATLTNIVLRTHWLMENSRVFRSTHWIWSYPTAADFYFMYVNLICLNSLKFWDVLAKNSWLSRQILMHRRRVWLHHIILGLEKAIKLFDEIWRFDRVVSVRKTEKKLRIRGLRENIDDSSKSLIAQYSPRLGDWFTIKLFEEFPRFERVASVARFCRFWSKLQKT